MPRVKSKGNVFRRHATTILAYLVIVLAAILIAVIGFGAFTFSEYTGVILPGVHVGTVNLSGQSQFNATQLVDDQLSSINWTPVVFTAGKKTWKADLNTLGVTVDIPDTVANAYSIGRSSNFVQNLIDRLPVKRHFSIGLLYSPHSSPLWTIWVTKNLADSLDRSPTNAWLAMSGDKAVVEPGAYGRSVNTIQALTELEANLGSLTTHTIQVPMVMDAPDVTDKAAAAMASRINAFLANPPAFRIGSHLVHLDPTTLASMISLGTRPPDLPVPVSIKPEPDWSAIQAYIYETIGAYNLPVQEPVYNYNAGQVSVITAAHNGFRYAGAAAFDAFEKDMTGWHPGGLIKVKGHIVKPVQNSASPATLGINTLLGEGQVSLAGSAPGRIQTMQAIAQQLNGVEIAPQAQISFNQYVNRGVTGTGWPLSAYADSGRLTGRGTIAPSAGGAMQEVATTFFRAGYAAGLPLAERHAHQYDLPWYTPAGMDAIVSPSGQDLVFTNSTGGYLLVQTRYEPVQQMLYIYIYGIKTGWQVTISNPKLVSTTSPPPLVEQSDPRLAPGQKILVQTALNGYDYTVTRTVTTSGSNPTTRTDTLTSDYQPRPATYLVGGMVQPTPTPTPTTTTTPQPTSSPAPTPAPSPTPADQ